MLAPVAMLPLVEAAVTVASAVAAMVAMTVASVEDATTAAVTLLPADALVETLAALITMEGMCLEFIFRHNALMIPLFAAHHQVAAATVLAPAPPAATDIKSLSRCLFVMHATLSIKVRQNGGFMNR